MCRRRRKKEEEEEGGKDQSCSWVWPRRRERSDWSTAVAKIQMFLSPVKEDFKDAFKPC